MMAITDIAKMRWRKRVREIEKTLKERNRIELDNIIQSKAHNVNASHSQHIPISIHLF